MERKDGPARPPSNMDRFERCFSIFKLEHSTVCRSRLVNAQISNTEENVNGTVNQQSWRAVRVDLVVSPYSQFSFATLGWTGSKVRKISLLKKI